MRYYVDEIWDLIPVDIRNSVHYVDEIQNLIPVDIRNSVHSKHSEK